VKLIYCVGCGEKYNLSSSFLISNTFNPKRVVVWCENCGLLVTGNMMIHREIQSPIIRFPKLSF